MLRQTTQAASPELQQLFDNIIAEEARNRATERRRVGREILVRPVDIEICGSQRVIVPAFSRDVSGMGVGLVSKEPVQPDTRARLHIHRFVGRPSILVGECRWCEPFGDEWHMSGWTLLSLESA